MARPLWLVNLIKRAFSSRFHIARLTTKSPAIRRLVDYGLFDQDDLLFLPKDGVVRNRIRVDQAIERPEGVVLPSRIVERFIEQAN